MFKSLYKNRCASCQFLGIHQCPKSNIKYDLYYCDSNNMQRIVVLGPDAYENHSVIPIDHDWDHLLYIGQRLAKLKGLI